MARRCVVDIGDDFEQLMDTRRTNRCDDPELGKVRSDRIDDGHLGLAAGRIGDRSRQCFCAAVQSVVGSVHEARRHGRLLNMAGRTTRRYPGSPRAKREAGGSPWSSIP
jgi:hypothetical protein